MWLAFGVEILASDVFALAGARVLFGRMGFTAAGAWLGAIVFAFSGFNLLHISHMNAVAIVARVRRFASNAWTRVSAPMPRARLVGEVRVSAAIAADIRTIDISTTALVDSPIQTIAGQRGDASVTSDRPGRIVVHTVAPEAQLLVLTERFLRVGVRPMASQRGRRFASTAIFWGVWCRPARMT